MGRDDKGNLDYDEKFIWPISLLQLFGFILLFIGVIVYNELIEVPYLGFNLNTKRAIAEREEQSEDRVKLSYQHKRLSSSSIDID